MSRYLKSSKDVKNKANKSVKPYYLLQQMEFLIPFTKTIDSILTKSEDSKYEDEEDENIVPETSSTQAGPSGQITYTIKDSDNTTVYATETISNSHEIMDDEGTQMEEDDDLVYEYELSTQHNIQPSLKEETAQHHAEVIQKHLTNIMQNPPQQQPQKQTVCSVIPLQLAPQLTSADDNNSGEPV